MSKKHFIALADALRSAMPTPPEDTMNAADMTAYLEAKSQWDRDCYHIARFCSAQNGRFDRQRWYGYINGDCGPNGEAIKR